MNENRELPTDFCAFNNLTIGGTLFLTTLPQNNLNFGRLSNKESD